MPFTVTTSPLTGSVWVSASTGCQPAAPKMPPLISGRMSLLRSTFPEIRPQTTGELTQFLEKIESFSFINDTEYRMPSSSECP